MAAAVAATEARAPAPATRRRPVGALLTAAFGLPGVVPGGALAQTVADHGIVELKALDYRDWQAGANRMRVRSPSIYALVPIGDTLEVEASIVYDSMSGASPLYFNTLSGASGQGVTDYRTAGDVKVTKYFGDWALGVGAVVSSERDYLSRGGSLDVRLFSDDRNRTWALGIAAANDRIDPVNGIVADAPRNTVEFLLGVTQALSADSIVQSNLTWSHGHGYFSDPYKIADLRPSERDIFAWLTRYNRYFAAPDAALRLSYRYLHDSFGSVSNTFTAAWVQSLPAGWSVTPGLRYYTQSAADFYYGPPPGYGNVPGQPYTADTRLAAFGAFTLGADMTKALAEGWSLNVRVDFYRQQSNWRPGGGSPGVEPFSARWLLVGISKTF